MPFAHFASGTIQNVETHYKRNLRANARRVTSVARVTNTACTPEVRAGRRRELMAMCTPPANNR